MSDYKKKQMSIILDDTLKEKVNTEAQKEKRSINKQVIYILEKYFENKKAS